MFLLSQGYTSELDIDLYRELLMKSSISISMDEHGWMEKVAIYLEVSQFKPW